MSDEKRATFFGSEYVEREPDFWCTSLGDWAVYLFRQCGHWQAEALYLGHHLATATFKSTRDAAARTIELKVMCRIKNMADPLGYNVVRP